MDDNPCIVFVHIYITGVKGGEQVVQIAALCNDSEFCKYMIPKSAIKKQASEQSGLNCKGGKLYYGNQKLETINSDDAAKQFIDYLRGLNSKVLLVGQQITTLAPIILNWLKEDLTRDLEDILYGYANTKTLLPQTCIKSGKNKNAELKYLANKYLPTAPSLSVKTRAGTSGALEQESIWDPEILYFSFSGDRLLPKASGHCPNCPCLVKALVQKQDALADCRLLQALLKELNIDDDQLKKGCMKKLKSRRLSEKKGGDTSITENLINMDINDSEEDDYYIDLK